jgi:hypothetical protein
MKDNAASISSLLDAGAVTAGGFRTAAISANDNLFDVINSSEPFNK